MRSKLLRYLKSSLFVPVLLCTSPLLAKTVNVSSVAQLQQAIKGARPGDMITLKEGSYITAEDIVIDARGTRDAPITICAQTTGGAEISGKGGFSLVSPAAYVTVKGFKFLHASSRAKMGTGTRFCRFTDNIFETTGDGEDLTVAGNDEEVDYNTFRNKNAMGRFVAIRGLGKQIAERLHIHHNYFCDFASQGGKNGAEAFQFGLSGFSMSSSNSIVEYNLFERCAGEAELISVKASAVTLRYNTIRDCPAQFTLRHGNKNVVYGNYFFNTPGLRIFGDDQLVFSNYFENCDPAITIGNGDGEVADGAKLTVHDRPDRILIAFNTLVNNRNNIVETARQNGLGATKVTLANNIIQGGNTAVSIAGPYADPQWIGNMLFNVKSSGDMPSAGYVSADPGLIKDASGIYRLKAGSLAVNHAVGAYPQVLVDIDGQPRVQPLDVGADEISDAQVKAHVLSVGETGASGKR